MEISDGLAPVPTDRLTTALAGALWLAGIVEVYSSRRRRGEGGESRVAESDGSPSALHTPAYDVTGQALVGALLEDATAHEAGRYEEIGRELPSIPMPSPGRSARGAPGVQLGVQSPAFRSPR